MLVNEFGSQKEEFPINRVYYFRGSQPLGPGPSTGTWRRSNWGQKSCQSGIFHAALMPHGTKIVYKTGCRDLRPKRLGTTVLFDLKCPSSLSQCNYQNFNFVVFSAFG